MGHLIMAGAVPPLAAATTTGSGNYTFLIVIVVLFALMYFVMIRPQRNRQRQMMQMQSNIAPGARVRTTAGMYATVTSVEGDDVVLEVAPDVHVRYLRRAIMDVLSNDGAADQVDEAADESGGEQQSTTAEDSAAAGDSEVTADAGGKDSADRRSGS